MRAHRFPSEVERQVKKFLVRPQLIRNGDPGLDRAVMPWEQDRSQTEFLFRRRTAHQWQISRKKVWLAFERDFPPMRTRRSQLTGRAGLRAGSVQWPR